MRKIVLTLAIANLTCTIGLVGLGIKDGFEILGPFALISLVVGAFLLYLGLTDDCERY